MTEKNSELIKSISINVGILLILVGALMAKDMTAGLFLGLILLAIQTFDFKTEPKKLIVAEIIIALSLSITTVTLLIMSRNFGTPQAFMLILLLGAVLVTVEALRKYADL